MQEVGAMDLEERSRFLRLVQELRSPHPAPFVRRIMKSEHGERDLPA
jgi:hypothetical protein